MTESKLILGGREFAPSGTAVTARQDDWMMLVIADAGLDAVLNLDFSLEENRRALVLSAIRSGRKHQLLAGVLVEVGVPWSVAGAEENAEFFGSLTEAADKALLNDVFVGVLVGFFTSGTGSSPISVPSSKEPARTRPRRKRSAADSASASGGPSPGL